MGIHRKPDTLSHPTSNLRYSLVKLLQAVFAHRIKNNHTTGKQYLVYTLQ